jgi:hypothetical protein
MNENSTSLAALKTQAAPPMKPGDDAAELGFFNGPSFALTYRVATVFAGSTLVPKQYQGNPGNCMIALNMAQRLGCDPLMAMQNLYVVHGTPAWSAQFLIATFNKCGRFSALRYEFQGKEGGDDWGCRAVAVELASGEKLSGPLVTVGLAKKEGWYSKSGSKWQTMPEQMLRYRAAAWFVRAYAPEIAMGLSMAEEMLDAKPNEFGVYESAGAAAVTTAEIREDAEEAPAKNKRVKEAIEAAAEAVAAPEGDTPGDGGKSPFDEPALLLEEVRAELKRLGQPHDTLPPDLAQSFGGDPSDLEENDLRKVLNDLKTRQ